MDGPDGGVALIGPFNSWVLSFFPVYKEGAEQEKSFQREF